MTVLPSSRNRTCWALAFGFVLLTHGGLIAVFGSATAPPPSAPTLQPAILVDLAPDPSADVASDPVAERVPSSFPLAEKAPPPAEPPGPAIEAPSPEIPVPDARAEAQTPADDRPSPDITAPDVVGGTPPPTVEASAPTAETPSPVHPAEPPAAPIALGATPMAKAQPPEAAKPRVVSQKPVPARPRSLRQPELARPNSTASASPAPSPPADTAARTPPLDGTSASLSWQTRLLAHLNRFKRFPPDAQMRRRQGTTLVHLRLMPDGSAEGVRIDGSSGTVSLDQEAVALIARAVPLPVPDHEAGAIEITIPILFTIK